MTTILSDLERKFGLPRLSQVADSLQRFPDTRQLKAIERVLTVAERVSQNGPELDKVTMLIKEINSLPVDKLEKLEKILKRVEKILRDAPKDLLQLLAGLKEE